MQITTDFSTRTLTALTATIFGVTGIFTIFILYPYFNRPSSTVTYYEHPGGAFHPHPYNHLSAPYIDTNVPNNWDTLPEAIFRSRTLLDSHVPTTPGSLPTTVTLSSILHIPDIVRENNVPSEGTSDREESVSTLRTTSSS
ncbi:hypothetical protein ARMSODRAFT_1026115 [Armillaria solidipes]|uniref:Uncharacterized protein n=1 Tax=Armillaria solidipes TaxID=1076256 RepID=A0A2H3B897_9AGAR|nr:hypothetical protein ARMSODRAFT_1026115 [Armillaria solidipes]